MADATTTPRDDVIAAFHRACSRPTAADIASWIERHPDHADDIRTHAEALLAGIQDRHLRPETSDGLLARTQASALGALESARARATKVEASPGLEALMSAAATDVPRVARALGLGRAPLVDLVQGRVVMPAPVALLAALADALRTTVAAVDAATRAAAPRMGPAKAEGGPSAPRRRFADIVRDDPTMATASKDLWLTLLED
ncbi:hypothetical protein [Lichenibacterium ramalinae]|uniref:Uncharacterized protein n=1 Tax=Lichenibacterium ramalinae TaxID=2316527 RepID=A0A4Q2R9F9_9HYPH|nr:hypothetical protein [Lichenibacterium ramalinae]RYB02140.1 hypothetical protein D3272_22735 [Lichenibacterium ramalinae]